MSLNDSTAAALGSAICSALNVTEASAVTKWQTICQQIYSHLKTDAIVTTGIPVSTTGSPSAQTGFTTSPGTLS